MAFKHLFPIFGMAALLAACASNNLYDGLTQSNKDEELHKPVSSQKNNQNGTLGLAFGGGGVRGFIHLGVIKALEESGIKADLVTGTSAGSIAATFYGSGKTYQQIRSAVDDVSPFTIADFVISNKGFVNGKKLAGWINTSIEQHDISNMPIPVGIAVTDLTARKAVLINQGNPGEAVQASSSIPGAFVPVESQNHILVDGGLLALVPVKFARAMGANKVIAVDIYCGNQPKVDSQSLADGTSRVMYNAFRLLSCELVKEELQDADIVLQPDFEPERMGSFDSKEKAIEAGYLATLEKIEQIKRLRDVQTVTF